LKLKYHEALLSFTYSFSMRRYNLVAIREHLAILRKDEDLSESPGREQGGSGARVGRDDDLRGSLMSPMSPVGRGLHSFTSQLNLNRVCHTKTPCTP